MSDRAKPASSYRFGCKQQAVCSGSVTLTAPSEPGTYELRFYDGSSANDLNLASQLTIIITVG